MYVELEEYSRNQTCLSLGRAIGYLLLKGATHLTATVTTTTHANIPVKHVTNKIIKEAFEVSTQAHVACS